MLVGGPVRPVARLVEMVLILNLVSRELLSVIVVPVIVMIVLVVALHGALVLRLYFLMVPALAFHLTRHWRSPCAGAALLRRCRRLVDLLYPAVVVLDEGLD